MLIIKYMSGKLMLTWVLLLITGFVYNVIFAGIPYQDPTREMEKSYDLQSTISGMVAGLGSVVLATGLIVKFLPYAAKREK